MIRRFQACDLEAVMQIWLSSNLQAHGFISPAYWLDHYAAVKRALPQAELYVYEIAAMHTVAAFIGLVGNDVAGIFVQDCFRSQGLGKQLLDYAKAIRPNLRLQVYQKNTRAVNFYHREKFKIQSQAMETSTVETEFTMVWRGPE